jgi:hypothetical protein
LQNLRKYISTNSKIESQKTEVLRIHSSYLVRILRLEEELKKQDKKCSHNLLQLILTPERVSTSGMR